MDADVDGRADDEEQQPHVDQLEDHNHDIDDVDDGVDDVEQQPHVNQLKVVIKG